jgi:hypothetical protein
LQMESYRLSVVWNMQAVICTFNERFSLFISNMWLFGFSKITVPKVSYFVFGRCKFYITFVFWNIAEVNLSEESRG